MKIELKIFVASVAIFISTAVSAQDLGFPVRGTLLEKGSQRPLPQVTIFVLPHKLKTVTDEQGQFSFENVPAGEFSFVVNLSNYIKLEKYDESSEEYKDKVRQLYLERNSYNSFETTIVSTKQKRDYNQKSLTQEQFLNLPGSGGDPVKAVQNLPGVNRVSGFSSQVVIQGSAPKDTSYNLDGHEIPLVFHFGGFSSVVMPEALETVDYFSAGFGSENSRALGGVISLKTRSPEMGGRKKKGFFFIDSLKSGGLFETQLSETSSLLVSGRYSYISLFLGAVAKNMEQLSLTLAPEFSDLTVIYKKKASEKDDFKLVAVASRDQVAFVFKEPLQGDPSIRGNFYNETSFYRFIPSWNRLIDDTQKTNFSLGVGADKIVVDVGSNYFNLLSNTLSARGEWEKKWLDNYTTQVGFDNTYSVAKVNIKLPNVQSEGGVSNPFSSGELREESIQGKINNIGLYLRNDYSLGSWNLLPSLRLDSFSQTKEKLAAPRMGLRFAAQEGLTYFAASGIYFQPPEPQETDSSLGNDSLKSPRAVHLNLGFEKDYRGGMQNGYVWSASYFDRWFDQLVNSSSNFVVRNGTLTAENYNNDQKGRAFGVETQLKYFDTPYTGWISYTWSRSLRWSSTQSTYTYPYDQTHNLNIVASRELKNNWKISGRWRYVTGNPFTPVEGGKFDADNDVFFPTRGAIYSKRYRDFSQLDLRFDRKTVRNTEIWTIYFDIQNVLNQKNDESLQYSYNYKSSEEITSLPILPSIGVKGEF